MLDHEHNLIVALCLGKELSGNERAEELNQILEAENAVAVEQPVRRLQEDLADWLKTSLAHVHSRQAAATRLWSVIEERDYSLADIPVKFRRQAFGGSLDIQRRLGKRPLHERLLRSVFGLLRLLITLAVIAAAALWAWKKFAG